MAGFVDLERIAARSDRALSRLDSAQTREIERYLTGALRRTLDQTQPLYARALEDVSRGPAAGSAFRLARGRVLADELEGTIRGLVAQPDAMLDGMLARTATAREEGREFVEAVLGMYGDAVTISTPVNHRALSGVVEHASTRLYRHADEVVDRIKDDVVTGLVRGDSWTQVTRAIREDTGYLRSRAEMIAITELHSAQADARQELYGDLGVELVIRYVTIDDRTCEYCAPRQGEVTKTSETTEVLHPRCRCILAPFDPEWALDDTLVPDELEAMLEDNLRQLEALGIEPKLGAAPFERVRDRQGFRVGPTGRGRPEVVWRPGQSTDRLVPWLGRSFTNLGAFATDAAGAARVPPASRSGSSADPVEQARTMPKGVREQFARIEDEAKGLRAEVERRTTEHATLRTTYTDARRELSRQHNAIRKLEDDLRKLAGEVEWHNRPSARLLPETPARLAELAEQTRALERSIRAAETLAAGQRSTVNTLLDQIAAARAARLESELTLNAFRRDRAHALMRNADTGHAPGRVPVKARMRDADLKARVERGSTWIEQHTVLKIERPTDVRRLKPGGRAFHRGGEVYVAPGDGVGTVVHELAHAIDHAHPSLVARAIAWRDARTAGESWQRLSALTGNSGYAAHEVAKPDRFFHPYIGKSYGTRATEVLSMGLEAMYDDPIKLARDDAGMFDLIFRIMKGLPDP